MRAAVLATSCLAALGGHACDGAMDAYFAADVVVQIDDVTYVEGSDNPRQRLDLYMPRGLDDFPVVIFVHGGYWVGQDKKYFEPVVGLYGNVGRALARRGIGAVVINYRLVPDVVFDQQFDDVAQAIAWTRDHVDAYGGDPSRLVLAGHSAGGHIAALAGSDEARLADAGVAPGTLRGIAALSPIFDLEHMAANPPPDRPNFNATVTTPAFGDDLVGPSPRTHFSADGLPLLVVMGDADEPFLLEQIPAAVDELTALGAPVEFEVLPGTTHADVVLSIDGEGDAVTPLVAAFVEQVAGS